MVSEKDKTRWTRPDARGQTRIDLLGKRHVIRRAVRDYLDGKGFTQIDMPLFVRGTTPDAAINAYRLGDRYLTTSTEHQMLRMVVGGFEKLYTLTQNFRAADGEGSTHNPEFTMLEWGSVGATLEYVENDAEGFICAAAKALGGRDTLSYQGRKIDLRRPWERLTVAKAVEKYVGVTLPDFTVASVRRAVEKAGITPHKEWENDLTFLFSVLIDHLQQFLGFERPVFLRDWPSFMTAMAGTKGEIAERSELYIGGIELSNGFPSLTDYEKQKAALQAQQERRKAEGKQPVEIDERYLESLREGMPPFTAMALGFDRLVMLLTDEPNIRNVLAFAWDEL